jgi:hypothetical protein
VLKTIDTLIGFIGVMLVLSLAVTALVQLVQNLMMLRANNLRVGLQALLEKLFLEQTAPVTEEEKARTGDAAKTKASYYRDKVLKLAPFVPEKESSILTKFFSPTTTWVKKDELEEHLQTAGLKMTDAQRDRLSLLFERMEDYLRKRFIMNVRMITIACAFVVAGYFQLSTPELLNRLSTDDEYRARAVAATEEVYTEAPALIAQSTNYQNVSEKALDQLASKHPEHVALFERASGKGNSKGEIIAELRSALATLPPESQARLLKEYDTLLTDLQKQAVADAGERFGAMTDRLGKFDIIPWPRGWSFYTKPNSKEIIGVLITVFFLTFGAPFWYERLRELIQLKDALKPKVRDEAERDKKAEESAQKKT